MKYIRTKDGKIFDTQYEPKAFKYNWNAKFIIDDNNLIVYDKIFKERIANHGEILKQADTIEELCDEFVLFREGKPFAIVPNEEHNAELAKYVWKDYRGAIWTEWGLKYVAKMNEKGELELL